MPRRPEKSSVVWVPASGFGRSWGSVAGALVGHSSGESKMIKHAVSGLFLDHLSWVSACYAKMVWCGRLGGAHPQSMNCLMDPLRVASN